MIDLGDVVPLTVQIRDADGELANASTVTLTITLPDLTVETHTVPPSTVGYYEYAFLTLIPGLHQVRWVSTGVNSAAYGPGGASFYVRPLNPTVVSLADAKEKLSIRTDGHDELIRDYIERAEASIAKLCGPLIPTAVTQRVTSNAGVASVLVLSTRPALSLTSVTSSAGEVLTGLSVSPAGVVSADDGSPLVGRFFDVSYIAGRTVLAPDLYGAVLDLVQHTWATQRGGSQRPGSTAQNTPTPGAERALPWRIEEAIAPHIQHGIG